MQHITLHCTGIGLWEVTGHRFVTKAALEDSKDPSRGHEDGRAATCNGASDRPCCASYVECPFNVSIDCIVYRHGLFELNYYYQNQINKALLCARPGQICKTSTLATSVFLTSPGSVSRITPGNRNFLILVFLTGIMDSGVFLIFQRNLSGGFSYRWFFLLVSLCCNRLK